MNTKPQADHKTSGSKAETKPAAARRASEAGGKKNSGHFVPPERSLLGTLLLRFGHFMTRHCVRLTCHNRENIPSNPPYVIAANHVTYVDGLWLLNSLSPEHRRRTCAMVGADLKTKHGMIGKILTIGARAIPVERFGNPVRSLIVAKNAVKAGNNILIHPEGTRTSTGKLGKFQTGAAYIAFKGGAPILPVYIAKAYAIWPRHQKRPSCKDPQTGKKRPLDLYFGKPLDPKDYSDPYALNDALEAWFLDMQEREGKGEL